MPEEATGSPAEATTQATTQPQADAGEGSSTERAVWAGAPREQKDDAAPPKGAGTSDPKTEAAPKSEPKTEAKAEPVEDPNADLEREIEKRVQSALKAQSEKARKQAEKAATEKADAELRDLLKKAKAGDYEAQKSLYERQLADLDSKYGDERYQEKFDQFKNETWKSYAGAFEVDPEDPAFMEVEGGMAGLTRALLGKSTSKPIIEAMLENPAVKAAVKAQIEDRVSKAVEAAKKDAMARALGSKDSPRLDAAQGNGGQALTLDQIEAAYAKDPSNRELAQQYAKAMRDSGRSF